MEQKSVGRHLRLALFAGAAAVSFAGVADAANVILDIDPSLVTEISGQTVLDGRYRISATNWDVGIAPGGSPIAGFASVNKGNTAALSGNTYAFTMKYTAGSGYSFDLGGTTVSWTTADGTKNGKSPTGAYNAILIYGRADAGYGSVTLSDLAFSIAGASTSGTLDTAMSTAADGSPLVQWLVGTGDLSSTSWTLTGNARLVRSISGCDECLKFDVFTKNVTYVPPVPLPAAAWLLLSGLGGLGILGRRRKAS